MSEALRVSKTYDEEIPVRASSGNIFADLGRPDAEEALARVRQLVQLEELKREIQKGIDSGEPTPWDTEEIKREGRQRRAAQAIAEAKLENAAHSQEEIDDAIDEALAWARQ